MNNLRSFRLNGKSRPTVTLGAKSAKYGVESFYQNGKSSKTIIEPERLNTPSFDDYLNREPYGHILGLLDKNTNFPGNDYSHSDKTSSEQIVSCIEQSGLTGCGGAHFPVATKWKAALANPGPRYLVVNGLEGEPYTFKDYSLMKAYPSIVLEGALLAARAVKASEVLVVINSAYRECLQNLLHAIAVLKEQIPNLPVKVSVLSGPDPDLYICGEESALVQFLEDKRGEPQLRPPFPFQKGYKGRPTIIQNVETVSWIPLLMSNPDLFRQQGNIKLANLWGDVKHAGIYEVTVGSSLAELLETAGGLTEEPSELQAIEVGGLAGGLLPPQCINLSLDHKAIRDAGAMVGSGSVRFLNTKRDLVAEMKKAMIFFQDESCGRCTPCRVGTQQLVKLAESLEGDHGSDDVSATSAEIAQTMTDTSICGLGKAAPMQLVSLLRYWDIRSGAAKLKTKDSTEKGK